LEVAKQGKGGLPRREYRLTGHLGRKQAGGEEECDESKQELGSIGIYSPTVGKRTG